MSEKFVFLIIWTVAAFTFFAPSRIFAAEIVLKKGDSVEAKVVEVTDKDLTIEFAHTTRTTYPLNEIKSINGMKGLDRPEIERLAKLGHEYVNNGKCNEALEILTKIMDLDPSNAQVVTDIALALERLKRHAETLPYALKEIEMNPRSGDAWSRLGNVYRHDESKEKEAIAAYEKAIELQGATVVNQLDLGCTYIAFKKYEKALPYLEKAITMEPESPEIKSYFYSSLGRCYLALDRIEEAIATLQKGIELFPASEQCRAYQDLSLAYATLGRRKATEYELKAKECAVTSSAKTRRGI